MKRYQPKLLSPIYLHPALASVIVMKIRITQSLHLQVTDESPDATYEGKAQPFSTTRNDGARLYVSRKLRFRLDVACIAYFLEFLSY